MHGPSETTVDAIRTFCRTSQDTRSLQKSTATRLKALRARQRAAMEAVRDHMQGGGLECVGADDGGFVRLMQKRVQQHLTADMIKRAVDTATSGGRDAAVADVVDRIFDAVREERTVVRPHVMLSKHGVRDVGRRSTVRGRNARVFNEYAAVTRELDTERRRVRTKIAELQTERERAAPLVDEYMSNAGVASQEIGLSVDGGDRAPHYICRKATLRRPPVTAAVLRGIIARTVQSMQDRPPPRGTNLAAYMGESIWERIQNRPPEQATRLTLERLRPRPRDVIGDTM